MITGAGGGMWREHVAEKRGTPGPSPPELEHQLCHLLAPQQVGLGWRMQQKGQRHSKAPSGSLEESG